MGLSRFASNRPRPVMNVTPLVDVVLVLLIIFMVVIPALAQGLSIEVPGITTPDDREEAADPFLLSVTRDGTLYLENAPVARAELETRLRAATRREPRRRLVVRGDRGARYGQVRAAYQVAQAIGFPGVSLRVSRRAGE